MTHADLLSLLRRKVAEYDAALGGRGGQSRVAAELGYSPSAVSQALSGAYKGNLDCLLTRVHELYGGSTVECPGLGEEIALSKCAEWRAKPFAATNPVRVRMYRACRQCDRR